MLTKLQKRSVWLRANEPPRRGSASAYLRWLDRMRRFYGRATRSRGSKVRVTWSNLTRAR